MSPVASWAPAIAIVAMTGSSHPPLTECSQSRHQRTWRGDHVADSLGHAGQPSRDHRVLRARCDEQQRHAERPAGADAKEHRPDECELARGDQHTEQAGYRQDGGAGNRELWPAESVRDKRRAEVSKDAHRCHHRQHCPCGCRAGAAIAVDRRQPREQRVEKGRLQPEENRDLPRRRASEHADAGPGRGTPGPRDTDLGQPQHESHGRRDGPDREGQRHRSTQHVHQGHREARGQAGSDGQRHRVSGRHVTHLSWESTAQNARHHHVHHRDREGADERAREQ